LPTGPATKLDSLCDPFHDDTETRDRGDMTRPTPARSPVTRTPSAHNVTPPYEDFDYREDGGGARIILNADQGAGLADFASKGELWPRRQELARGFWVDGPVALGNRDQQRS